MADPPSEAATVQASGFAEGRADAARLAAAAADATPCLSAQRARREYPAVALNDLAGEGAWIQGRRYAVDMCWVDDSYADVGAVYRPGHPRRTLGRIPDRPGVGVRTSRRPGRRPDPRTAP